MPAAKSGLHLESSTCRPRDRKNYSNTDATIDGLYLHHSWTIVTIAFRQDREFANSLYSSLVVLLGLSSFSKLCGILELKVGHANIFNFSPNIRNLSNSISRDSGGSSDSNHTRYMDYGCRDPKEMGIIFPSLGDA
jgi:hypothetical protein